MQKLYQVHLAGIPTKALYQAGRPYLYQQRYRQGATTLKPRRVIFVAGARAQHLRLTIIAAFLPPVTMSVDLTDAARTTTFACPHRQQITTTILTSTVPFQGRGLRLFCCASFFCSKTKQHYTTGREKTWKKATTHGKFWVFRGMPPNRTSKRRFERVPSNTIRTSKLPMKIGQRPMIFLRNFRLLTRL